MHPHENVAHKSFYLQVVVRRRSPKTQSCSPQQRGSRRRDCLTNSLRTVSGPKEAHKASVARAVSGKRRRSSDGGSRRRDVLDVYAAAASLPPHKHLPAAEGAEKLPQHNASPCKAKHEDGTSRGAAAMGSSVCKPRPGTCGSRPMKSYSPTSTAQPAAWQTHHTSTGALHLLHVPSFTQKCCLYILLSTTVSDLLTA